MVVFAYGRMYKSFRQYLYEVLRPFIRMPHRSVSKVESLPFAEHLCSIGWLRCCWPSTISTDFYPGSTVYRKDLSRGDCRGLLSLLCTGPNQDLWYFCKVWLCSYENIVGQRLIAQEDGTNPVEYISYLQTHVNVSKIGNTLITFITSAKAFTPWTQLPFAFSLTLPPVKVVGKHLTVLWIKFVS